MTEEEWLTATDPTAIVDYLIGRVSNRKLRLYGCGWVRGGWHVLPEDCFRDAVVMAERYVDGEASWQELKTMRKINRTAFTRERNGLEAVNYTVSSYMRCAWACTERTQEAARAPLRGFFEPVHRTWEVFLLRDIFGNPFRPVTADPSWLTPTVVALADAIYADRAFDRMPILADALEEAGCDHPDVLTHCRGDGPHVRGCWVVDLLLGKS